VPYDHRLAREATALLRRLPVLDTPQFHTDRLTVRRRGHVPASAAAFRSERCRLVVLVRGIMCAVMTRRWCPVHVCQKQPRSGQERELYGAKYGPSGLS